MHLETRDFRQVEPIVGFGDTKPGFSHPSRHSHFVAVNCWSWNLECHCPSDFTHFIFTHLSLEPHPSRYYFQHSNRPYCTLHLTGSLVALAQPKHRAFCTLSTALGWFNRLLDIPICTVLVNSNLW